MEIGSKTDARGTEQLRQRIGEKQREERGGNRAVVANIGEKRERGEEGRGGTEQQRQRVDEKREREEGVQDKIGGTEQ